ncbi:hypothetical protein MTO96_002391 [Rhipicephalus appendiculatus]
MTVEHSPLDGHAKKVFYLFPGPAKSSNVTGVGWQRLRRLLAAAERKSLHRCGFEAFRVHTFRGERCDSLTTFN